MFPILIACQLPTPSSSTCGRTASDACSAGIRGSAHRSVTPLELLFDLTFVVAFAQAGDQLAHYVAEGHIATAVWGFAFVLLSVCWAWINFTWFASAFDTDDWLQRVLTMVQMVGVIVLALGIPAVFESIDTGESFDFVLVAVGYVIMRVSLVLMWLRVARQDPANRRVALRYAGFNVLIQAGWLTVALLRIEERSDPGRVARHALGRRVRRPSVRDVEREGHGRRTGRAPRGMPATSPSGTDCS